MAEKDTPYSWDESEKRAQTDVHKCPSCGSNMTFDPEKQVLACPFCGQTVDFKKDSDVKERDILTAFDTAEKWEDTSVVSCDNCGAKFVISENDVALECPYCGTSHVRKSADLAGVKPNALYPFLISADRAESLSKKWAKRRIFAPSKFKKSIEAKNLHGVYEPCFTFDSRTFSSYDGKLGETKTRTVRTKNGTRTETYVEWHYVSGTISHFFDDVTIAAGKELDQKAYNKISPFDISTIKVYSKDYLAGYSAKHYDKSLKDAWQESKGIMDERLRKLILEQNGCDVIGYLNVSTVHNDVTFKYVLLPLYLLNYRYKKKNYKVAVNGNTGRVVGKTPVSFWRVLIAVILGIGVVAGLLYLFYNYGEFSVELNAFNSLLLR